MDFTKKYYNGIVGVAIVGVFVLGLTISGSASNILASISNVVGGQQAQVTAPTCVLSRDLTTGSTGEDVRVLQKFLNRLGYTLTIIGNPGSPGLEYEKFNSLANNTGVPLAMYQAEYGIIPADGVLKSFSRASINPKLISADCAPNSPYHFKYFLGPEATYAPNQNISVVLAGEEKIDKTDLKSAEGFNVQAYLYKKSTNRVTSLSSAQRLTPNPALSYNGRFNTQTNQWELNMLSPATPGDYFLRVVIYCSKSGSYCANKYGIGGEVRQVVPIKVNSVASTTPLVQLISTSATVRAGAPESDTGTFTIKYKVTATSKDIRLPINYCNNATTSLKGVIFEVDKNGVIQSDDGVSCNLSSSKIPVSGEVLLPKGSSADFTLTTYVVPKTSGLFAVKMKGFNWGEVSGSYPNLYSVPSTFKTSYIALKAPVTISTPLVEFVSARTSVAAGSSSNDDQGTFTIRFKVTAGANAIYVSSLADAKLSGVTTGKTSVLIDRAGVAVIGGVSVALSNITDWSTNAAGLYTIRAGESETFELTSTVQLPAAGTFGLYRATLGGLSWGTSSTDSTPNNAISNLSTFKTSYISLN